MNQKLKMNKKIKFLPKAGVSIYMLYYYRVPVYYMYVCAVLLAVPGVLSCLSC